MKNALDDDAFELKFRSTMMPPTKEVLDAGAYLTAKQLT